MSITLIQGDSFLSAGVGKRIKLPGGADYFKAVNTTKMALAGTSTTISVGNTAVVSEFWVDRTTEGHALVTYRTQSTGALNTVEVTSGGFVYTNGVPPSEPVLTGTTISQADGAVATVSNSYSTGDRVRLTGVVGMRQISGMVFTISATATSIVLPGLDSSGFAAAGSAFKVRKVAETELVLPEYIFVTGISLASAAVVKLASSPVGIYALGMNVRFDVPSTYGMQEINGLQGTIIAVGSFSITVDIDSSGFTAFAFPTSADSVSEPRFATIAPSGQKAYYDVVNDVQYGYNVNEAPFKGVYGAPSIYLSAGILSPAGQSGDVIEWQAFRYE